MILGHTDIHGFHPVLRLRDARFGRRSHHSDNDTQRRADTLSALAQEMHTLTRVWWRGRKP